MPTSVYMALRDVAVQFLRADVAALDNAVRNPVLQDIFNSEVCTVASQTVCEVLLVLLPAPQGPLQVKRCARCCWRCCLHHREQASSSSCCNAPACAT